MGIRSSSRILVKINNNKIVKFLCQCSCTLLAISISLEILNATEELLLAALGGQTSITFFEYTKIHLRDVFLVILKSKR